MGHSAWWGMTKKYRERLHRVAQGTTTDRTRTKADHTSRATLPVNKAERNRRRSETSKTQEEPITRAYQPTHRPLNPSHHHRLQEPSAPPPSVDMYQPRPTEALDTKHKTRHHPGGSPLLEPSLNSSAARRVPHPGPRIDHPLPHAPKSQGCCCTYPIPPPSVSPARHLLPINSRSLRPCRAAGQGQKSE